MNAPPTPAIMEKIQREKQEKSQIHQQKEKRKKHRPKVIVERKSAETPKAVYSQPSEKITGKRKYVKKVKDDNAKTTIGGQNVAEAIPGKREHVRKNKVDRLKRTIGARNVVKPTSGKRKYTRKNNGDSPKGSVGGKNVVEATPGKRKYVRKKKEDNPKHSPESAIGECNVIETENFCRNKSVRRSLNFCLDNAQSTKLNIQSDDLSRAVPMRSSIDSITNNSVRTPKTPNEEIDCMTVQCQADHKANEEIDCMTVQCQADHKAKRKCHNHDGNDEYHAKNISVIPCFHNIPKKRRTKNYVRNTDNMLKMSIVEAHNPIVPFMGAGMMMPYEGPFEIIKRKKRRAKVDLDNESKRVWKLLIGKESDGGKGTNVDTEKWWEEERQVFQGRIDAFIARMHLVQGDRQYSQWKGSVVDSVVGVYLTQNVSDHLSSSAFMSLAARFPCKSSQRVNSEIPDSDESRFSEKASSKTAEYDWDSLRRQVFENGFNKERSCNDMDSMDYEALRKAHVNEISDAIRERGMHEKLAMRIKDFLDRVVRDHGSIDLEWIKHVSPDKAKDYLQSIDGLGPKSVECVRLLTLHQLAFPVDTNVARISVRLGWVPLQPLPESLQLHLLEMYPMMETVQKYLWPRLCKLDQQKLYELHYQLITFGKVFCTKIKPNCNSCPMRGECRHFASAYASAKLALPGPDEKPTLSTEQRNTLIPKAFPLPQLMEPARKQEYNNNSNPGNHEPIVEEPSSPEPEPEPECLETSLSDTEESVRGIEDAFYDDPDEIPTINLNIEEFTQNIRNCMHENNMQLEGIMSNALVVISPDAAMIPVPKLKNVNRLRTEHQVYVLPDEHPLLERMDKRDPEDPSPYLLAIWTAGETAESTEFPRSCCDSQDSDNLCNSTTCFNCNSIREARSQTVRGTILIPSRTANRGSFPLNGTYFQVNEVFADHDSSCSPIDVPRGWIWELKKRTVYFGSSIPSIFKGLTVEEIQLCFWRGFVCVRGFDRATRAPKPLYARLHLSKPAKTKKYTAAAVKRTTMSGKTSSKDAKAATKVTTVHDIPIK